MFVLPTSMLRVFSEGNKHARLYDPTNTNTNTDLTPPPLRRKSGFRRPLGSSKRTFFSDRFNLGGPMTLRGFPFYGAGPRAPKEEGGCRGGDALGGDIRYTGRFFFFAFFIVRSFSFAFHVRSFSFLFFVRSFVRSFV